MKRLGVALAFAAAAYVATGLFVVQGNEKGVVRRFGRIVTTPDGRAQLLGSGLHYDLPSPFSRVDRINLNEVHTLAIGSVELDAVDDGGFLRTLNSVNQSQFLTGDKNILHVQIGVQYRVSETGVIDYLFASESPQRRLEQLAEATAADLIAASGVDFVHPLGLGELRALLTARVRTLVERQRLGIEVDEVAVNAVYPPARVKAYFLDVANARADKENYIHAARAYADQRQSAARAEERQTLDEAQIYRRDLVEQARGEAESFGRLIAEFKRQEGQGVQTYAQARRMALRRMYVDTVEEIFSKVAGKVFLDSGQQVDLTIFRNPKE